MHSRPNYRQLVHRSKEVLDLDCTVKSLILTIDPPKNIGFSQKSGITTKLALYLVLRIKLASIVLSSTAYGPNVLLLCPWRIYNKTGCHQFLSLCHILNYTSIVNFLGYLQYISLILWIFVIVYQF